MPLTLLGSTSGSVTIAAPAVAGSTTQTLVNVTGTLAPIVSGTVNAGGTNPFPSTGGPATVDFTGIPSWVKRITVMFSGVSTSGTSQPLFQLGDSGGVETTGYATVTSNITTAANAATAYTNGWQLFVANASRIMQGNIVFSLLDASTNTWSGNGQFATTDVASIGWCSGTKSLSSTLDRVRITTANGTDLFDAGTINILYE